MITRVERTCANLECGKVFFAIPAEVSRGGGKYCSRACASKRQQSRSISRVQQKCPTCGEIFFALQAEVNRGWGKYCSRSCVPHDNLPSLVTHGQTGTRLYRIWKGMNARCHNPNHTDYERYGAKGVTVYADWRESFEVFCAWMLANGYVDGLTIDRRKNTDPYSPNTCRVATYSQQSANRQKSKKAKGSQYKGVHPNSPNRWEAHITHNHKRIYLGMFRDEVEAARAYDFEAKKLHGEFASLNFPEPTPTAPQSNP